MRPSPFRILAVSAALVALALGLVGAYSYGNDYDLHRGFTPVARLSHAGKGRLLEEHFYSPALHRRTDYLVYLPPGYTRRRHYPVYYLLQGEPSQPLVFVDVADMDIRLDNLMAKGLARPMILVYPDGRIDGHYFSDSEWANSRAGGYESAMLETVRNVDRRFSTIRDRDGRVLAGFSMGAYGALNIGLQHVREFASLQSWSGYVIETRSGVFAHASARTLARNSPGEFVTRLRRVIARHPLRVFMYIGNHDSGEREQAPMARALREAGAHVTAHVYPGGHDWELWWAHLNQMIELASYDLRHPPARTHVPRGIRIVPVSASLAVVSKKRSDLRHGGRRHHAHPALAAPSSAVPGPGHRVAPAVVQHHRHCRSTLGLIGALLLALLASALINLGFVLQHHGHVRARRHGSERLVDLFRTPLWLGGQLVGWTGWTGQILALALVPLTLVQAFSAGGLAVSVPLAAWLFGYRINRAQIGAIIAIGLALASLPLGAAIHGHLRDGELIATILVFSLAAAVACVSRSLSVRAVAAGVLYGLADGAIKADAIALRHHGIVGLLGGWTIVAALATLGGFLAFQSSLTGDDAVRPMSLMAAFSALTGVAIGVLAFHEPLGSRLDSGIVHLIAIGIVLACVPPLVRAQSGLTAGGGDAQPSAVGPEDGACPAREAEPDAVPVAERVVEPDGVGELAPHLWWAPRLARRLAIVAVAALASLLAVLAGSGLLFSLRGLHVLGVGPRVADALGLLQLAQHSAQPLGRVLVAWLIAGIALGVLLERLGTRRRLLVILPIAAPLLLFASDACVAVTRNVALGPVLINRDPGLGPWLECLLLGVGALLPGWLGLERRFNAAIAALAPSRLESSATRP